MLNFLKQTRKFVNAKDSICIVLGNESCDLDSAVSALSLAYFYQKEHEADAKQYLPVLNIPRRDYPLKTEVLFLLRKYAITEEMLTFRDELHDDFLARSVFILVDHHVSPFVRQCVEVYDHRPRDMTVDFNTDCKLNMEIVGSCATLIGEYGVQHINDDAVSEGDAAAMKLLRSTILLDTVNLSATAGRATPRDHRVCVALEEVLRMNAAKYSLPLSRNEDFEELRLARADVGSLTTLQVLRKDLKLLSGGGARNVALPGFPLLVQRFIERPNALEAVKQFASEYNCPIVLLMGMYVDECDGSVQRDLGLININGDSVLCDEIEKKLLANNAPELSLKLYPDCQFMNGRFYKQQNVKATRKHILPIIKRLLDQSEAK